MLLFHAGSTWRLTERSIESSRAIDAKSATQWFSTCQSRQEEIASNDHAVKSREHISFTGNPTMFEAALSLDET